jgi:ABC-type dipeptide/oligopeptide/nickel transport systems, permease components
LGAPWLAPYDPSQQFFDGLTLEGAPLPPSARFWLGTDLLGRDLLSRLIFGARTSLMIGVAANTAAVALGALVGVIAGYLQGPVGFTLMRLTDLMIAFPLCCWRSRSPPSSRPASGSSPWSSPW